jgi:class 3 adenylate cyclase
MLRFSGDGTLKRSSIAEMVESGLSGASGLESGGSPGGPGDSGGAAVSGAGGKVAADAGAATADSKSEKDGAQQERRRKWRSSLIRVNQSLVFQTTMRNESLKRHSDEVDVVLRRQVSRYLQWALRNGYFAESWSENRACAHDVSGVMVFVDLKNYTKLTEMLARRSGSATDKLILGSGVLETSSDASETVNQVLNQYWELVISLVHRFQGDVVKFLGDGLQIMLPMQPVFSHLPEAAAAAACKRRALLLAIELLQALADFSLTAALPELGVEAMQVKIGMAFGRASVAVLGGVCRRFEFVLAGEAANRAAELSETPAPETAGNGVSFAVVCAEIANSARLQLAPGAAHALVLLPSPGDAESACALQVLREDLLAELPGAGGAGELFCPYSGVAPSQTLELGTEFRRLRKSMLARSRQRMHMSPDEAGDAASPHSRHSTLSDRRSMSLQSSAERQQHEMRSEPAELAEQSESGELAVADATALAVASRPAQACNSAGPSRSVAYRERDTQFAARSRRQKQFIWQSPELAREPDPVTVPRSPQSKQSPQSQQSLDRPEDKQQQEPGLDMFQQLELLGGFIPNVLLKSVASGQSESAFIQSFLSVMFVRVLNVTSSGPLDLDMMQLAATEAMVAIMNNCGDLRQIALDDKGFVVIGIFNNLNDCSGDKTENEAFGAALELRDRFEQLGFRAGIGLASGFARSGMTGTPHRSEFTVVGSPVNLSARLMSLAANAVAAGGYSSASSAIFLDEETAAGVDTAWLEEEHVTGLRLRVKGFEKRVQVMFPTSGERPDEALRVAIAVGDEEAQASAESLVQSRPVAVIDKSRRSAASAKQRARSCSTSVVEILNATSEIQNGETINDVLRYLAVMSAASPYVETHVLYRAMEATNHTRGAIEYALKVLCTRFNVLECLAEDSEQYFIRGDESSSFAIARSSSIAPLAESAISAQQPPQRRPPSPQPQQQQRQPQQQQSGVVRSPRRRLMSLYSSLMRAFRTRLHLELAAIYSVGSTGHTLLRTASPVPPAAHSEQEGPQQQDAPTPQQQHGSKPQATPAARLDPYEVSGLHYALAGEEQHLTAAHFLNMSLARCDRDNKPRIDTLVSQSRSLVQSWARVQEVKAEKELALCEYLQAEAALELHRAAEALDGFKRCLAAYTSLADYMFEPPIDDAASASASASASSSAAAAAAAAAVGASALITSQRLGSERLASYGNGSARGGSGGGALVGTLSSLFGSIELFGSPPPVREYRRTTLVLLVHYLDSAQSFSLQFVAIKLVLPGAVYETLPCLARVAPPPGTGTSGCVVKSLRAPDAMTMYSLPGYLKAEPAQFLQVVLPDTTAARQVLTSLFQLGALSDRQQQQGPSASVQQQPGGASLRRNSLGPSMGRRSSRERNSIKERLAGPNTSISPAHTPLPERRDGQQSRACALM